MILGELLSAFPHRQFHTLPGLLDSWAALPNSNPNALRAMQGGSLYHFYEDEAVCSHQEPFRFSINFPHDHSYLRLVLQMSASSDIRESKSQ